MILDEDARARILAIATDFPRRWDDPHTPDRERTPMVRLLMEDVTLTKTADGLTAQVRLRGGATTTRTLARALNAWQLRETSAEIVALIDQLLDSHADRDIATILNARGYVSGTGQPFQRRIVNHRRMPVRAAGPERPHQHAGSTPVGSPTARRPLGSDQ